MTQVPEQIDRYAVTRKLGAGGMGEVYLAYSRAGDMVAVKQIRADRLDQQTRSRFEQEALKARTVVGTQRVARFLDADPFAERPWMAMEYIAGPTLDDLVDASAPLPALLVASLGALVAEGLAAVHAVGLLHRDFKPGNLIMGENGPVLIDFGLAAFADATSSLSHPGMQIGTPVAMPPEQANGQTNVTPAADVYGFGTVLLYAAAGHYPYSGDRRVILDQVANSNFPPNLSGIPEELSGLISSMLAYEPSQRPTLDEVVEACRDIVLAHGQSMSQARRALLAHVERHRPQRETDSGTGEVESWFGAVVSSLDALVAADAAELDFGSDSGWVGPLDAPRAPDTASVPAEPSEAPAPVGAGVPSATAPGGSDAEARSADAASVKPVRLPAARRIADELREAYAAGPAL